MRTGLGGGRFAAGECQGASGNSVGVVLKPCQPEGAGG